MNKIKLHVLTPACGAFLIPYPFSKREGDVSNLKLAPPSPGGGWGGL